MAITVLAKGQLSVESGVTTGNEYIFKVDPNKTIVVEGQVTSAGTAAVKYSTRKDVTPTDFTTFAVSAVGDHTANFSESSVGAGVEWIGIDVASGTWTVAVREV